MYLPGPSPVYTVRSNPSQLLRAEELCVHFHSVREPLLDDVTAWASKQDIGPLGLQLMVGAGGSGKTRLMLEACKRLATAGWQAGFLRKQGDLDRLARLGAASKLLVVVDYAETRRPEVTALVKMAMRGRSAHPIRIVLLARAAGE